MRRENMTNIAIRFAIVEKKKKKNNQLIII